MARAVKDLNKLGQNEKETIMKNKEIKKLLENMRIPMNIQLFAGEDAGSGDNGTGAGGGEAGGTEGNDPGGEDDKTFDDVLKDSRYQAEFDRRVQKAVETAVSKAQEKWQIQNDESASEAERLAKMNEAEKAQFKAAKKEKELSDREAKLVHRELVAEAKGMLSDRGLDPALAETIVHSGMDADAVEAVVKTLEKSFQQNAKSAVEAALKGGKPPKKAEAAGDPAADEAKKIRDAVFKGFF